VSTTVRYDLQLTNYNMRLMTNDTYHLINYRDGFDLYLHLYIKLRPMLEDRFKLY